MRLVSVIFFAMIPVIFVSCGIARSTSSISKAENQREKSLGKIATAFEKTDTLETDEFGRKSLAKKAADEVKPLEKRKAAYFFFKGDAYLSKAYDFRSKSIYDSSEFLAEKALEYFTEAEKIAGGEQPAPAPEVKPTPAPEVKPTPAPEVKPTPAPEVKPTPAPEVKPTPAPEVKPTPAPDVKPTPAPEVKPEPEPQPVVTPDPEEKPSLKGDPFAEKKEEPKKAEPEKKEEKKPSYYDVYEEMRQKYLKKQSEEKEKEKQEEKKEEKKKENKKDDSTAPQGGAK